MPAVLNDADVLVAEALPKVTVPGPETLVQVLATLPGELGRPSSVTLPVSDAVPGSWIVWSGPAFTTGTG